MSKSVDPKIYQANLKAWREQSGLTLEQAGEALGVAHTTVQRWENSTIDLTTRRLVDICRLYKVTPQMLLAPPPEADRIQRMAELNATVASLDEESYQHLLFVAKKLRPDAA